MAIKTSGSLSMTEIVAEFGGSAPHSLSEYYGVASGIPTSGTIAYNQFYGKSAQIALTYPAGNNRRVNLADWVVSQGYAASGNFKITIPSDATFWSDDISLPALDASGLGSLHLVNNGIIMGKGGQGRGTGTSSTWTRNNLIKTPKGTRIPGAQYPTDGGPALSMCAGVVENNGYIAGGGGGAGANQQFAGLVINFNFGYLSNGAEHVSKEAGFSQGSGYRWWYAYAFSGKNVTTTYTSYSPELVGNWCVTGIAADTAQDIGTIVVRETYGCGGGAGGGQGGRSTGIKNVAISTTEYFVTDMPTTPNAIGQTAAPPHLARGAGIGSFTVQDAGYNTEQPAAPADGGGVGGIGHMSSIATFGGGHTY